MQLTISIIGLIFICTVILFMLMSFYITIFGGGPFVPTKMPAVHEVLKHAKIRKNDKVYDIGAGDNRFIHFAVKDYGAKGVGIEMDPFVYFIAKMRQWFWGWKGKIIRENSLKQDLSDANVVICYMLPKPLRKFQKKFDKDLRKGTRVVSYAFHIGDWKPKKIIPKKEKISQIFVYEK